MPSPSNVVAVFSELVDLNIRVNAIALGPVDTEATRQVPAWVLDHVVNGLALKRLGETVVVVNLAKLLASDEAAWIAGHTFRVDMAIPCCRAEWVAESESSRFYL